MTSACGGDDGGGCEGSWQTGVLGTGGQCGGDGSEEYLGSHAC